MREVLFWPCVVILLTERRQCSTKPCFQSSSKRESTKHFNQTSDVEKPSSPTTATPSDCYASDNDIFRGSTDMEISGSIAGANSLQVQSFHRNSANDYLSKLSYLNIDENKAGRPSYKRVYVGEDSSGSEIYSSAPVIERSSTLARLLRGLYHQLGIMKNLQALPTNENKTNSFRKPLAKRKSKSTKSRKIIKDSQFSRVSNNDSKVIRGGNFKSNLKSSDEEKKSESLALRKDGTSCSDKKLDPNTSSGSFTLEQQQFMYSQYMAACMNFMEASSSNSLQASTSSGNFSFSPTLGTLEEYCSKQLQQPGPSGQKMAADTLASQQSGSETFPIVPPFRPDFDNEYFYLMSGKDNSKNVETDIADDTEPEMDDTSLPNFVTAVHALQTLVEKLDESFGSARRLRVSLEERPQESGNLLEEISGNLQMMIDNLGSPEVLANYDDSSEELLYEAANSVEDILAGIWEHIINFKSGNAKKQRERLEYLLAVLRELRNNIDAAVEDAGPILQLFHTLGK